MIAKNERTVFILDWVLKYINSTLQVSNAFLSTGMHVLLALSYVDIISVFCTKMFSLQKFVLDIYSSLPISLWNGSVFKISWRSRKDPNNTKSEQLNLSCPTIHIFILLYQNIDDEAYMAEISLAIAFHAFC